MQIEGIINSNVLINFCNGHTNLSKNKRNNSKRGDSNHKIKLNKLKQIIRHDLPQKVEYCRIKQIKLFGSDWKSQIKTNYLGFLFVNVKYWK